MSFCSKNLTKEKPKKKDFTWEINKGRKGGGLFSPIYILASYHYIHIGMWAGCLSLQ